MEKIIRTTLYSLLLFLFATACRKDEEKFPRHEPPVWQINYSAGYYENMTAVVKLPTNLAKYANTAKDQLAAFASDGKCRGIGEFINGAYFVSIRGASDDRSNIYFMYYSSRNKYLYKTDDIGSFDADRIFGTADNPKELILNVVR